MKILSFFILIFSLHYGMLFSQVSVSSNNTPPDGSAMLDVQSTSKGLLPPRMTVSQRTQIGSPTAGLLVYQTDATSGYYFYNGTGWILLGGSEGTGGQMIDVDGNVYPTVRIGGQEWMAENLRVTHYRNGNTIPNVTDNSAWSELTTGAYCWYENDQSTYAKYGALYNWYAVNDNRNLCPVGWHVPSDAEWTTLTTYLGGISVAGGKMKAAILWDSPNAGATNSSGFSGLPGGSRDEWGCYGIGSSGAWWTSTEYDGYLAWLRTLGYISQEVHRYEGYKMVGNSVRCLRDN